MPIPQLSPIGGGSIQELVDALEKQRKQIDWLLTSLDTTNVKELDADVINAGTLNAGLVTIRTDFTSSSYMQMDATGFRSFDGLKYTFELNASGKAYFRGDITSDATITGAAFRTGVIGTDRIEISGGAFKGVTSGGLLTGLVFDIGVFSGSGIADVYLYHNNAKLMEFHDEITMFTIRPGSGSLGMGIGGNGLPTYGFGSWSFTDSVNFSSATVTGLETNSSGIHNHGIPNGAQLLTGYYDGLAGAWVVSGSVGFVWSGDHTHVVT